MSLFGTQTSGNAGVISLSKGETISLAKKAPSLKEVYVGLGWDEKKGYGSADYDLDVSVFMLGENGKVINPNANFIFYGNLDSPCGSIHHTGDNRTGQGDGDDEVVIAKLDKVPEAIKELVFTVTIHEARANRQNFGQIQNAFIRLCDNLDSGKKEIARYDLTEQSSSSLSMIFARLVRGNDGWQFQAMGEGLDVELAGVCTRYGVSAQ